MLEEPDQRARMAGVPMANRFYFGGSGCASLLALIVSTPRNVVTNVFWSLRMIQILSAIAPGGAKLVHA
jgi:hypothetical protein